GDLLVGHLQREEVHGSLRTSHMEGDVGRQRGLAHRWAAGEDDQVGALQAAELGVQIDKSSGKPSALAVCRSPRVLEEGVCSLGECLCWLKLLPTIFRQRGKPRFDLLDQNLWADVIGGPA